MNIFFNSGGNDFETFGNIIPQANGRDGLITRFIESDGVLHYANSLSVDSFENSSFRIYPNPSNGVFMLSYSGQEKLKYLKVLDINGKEIKTIFLDNFSVSREINLGQISQGLYFITIESDSSRINKRMIIK